MSAKQGGEFRQDFRQSLLMALDGNNAIHARACVYHRDVHWVCDWDWPAALLATLAIFLPSFVLVALIHPVALRLRQAHWASTLLDGVNATALALMAGVLMQLGQQALKDVFTWAIAALAFVILLHFQWNSVWLILDK